MAGNQARNGRPTPLDWPLMDEFGWPLLNLGTVPSLVLAHRVVAYGAAGTPAILAGGDPISPQPGKSLHRPKMLRSGG
jgi:hypothetical protein